MPTQMTFLDLIDNPPPGSCNCDLETMGYFELCKLCQYACLPQPPLPERNVNDYYYDYEGRVSGKYAPHRQGNTQVPDTTDFQGE